MSLANLYNTPESDEHFLVWSFSNQDQHNQIARALAARKSVNIPDFPLDPIPMNDVSGWARQHQAAHNNFTQALGIGGVDLTDVNLKDPGELAAWIRLHAEEHRQAAQILGIT
jgi:hypothetical protein